MPLLTGPQVVLTRDFKAPSSSRHQGYYTEVMETAVCAVIATHPYPGQVEGSMEVGAGHLDGVWTVWNSVARQHGLKLVWVMALLAWFPMI